MLQALDFHTSDPAEVVLVGPSPNGAAELARAVRTRYFPNKVLVVADEGDTHAAGVVPLLQDRPLVDGRPTAFVCHHGRCELPVTTEQELLARLGQ